MPEDKKGTAVQTQTDAVAASLTAYSAENAELRADNAELKKANVALEKQLNELATKVERDSREMMYPVITAKFDMTRTELDAMPIMKIRELRESAARVAVAAQPHGKLNSVFSAGDAANKGGIPDMYGKTPQQIAEIVSKL